MANFGCPPHHILKTRKAELQVIVIGIADLKLKIYKLSQLINGSTQGIISTALIQFALCAPFKGAIVSKFKAYSKFTVPIES